MGYTIPRSYIDNFSDGIEAISSAHKQLLASALAGVDLSQPGAEDVVVSLIQNICDSSTKSAAYLAKRFYLGLRSQMVVDDGYEGVTDTGYVPGATETATRGIMSAMDYANVIAGLQERVGYETKRASHRTVYACGLSDPRRPRFARIPQPSKSYAAGCPFCQMLASRGFVYASRATASVHTHDGCRCVVVPSWDTSPAAEGYEPKDYWDGYQRYLAHDYSQPDRTTPHRSLEWQQEHSGE